MHIAFYCTTEVCNRASMLSGGAVEGPLEPLVDDVCARRELSFLPAPCICGSHCTMFSLHAVSDTILRFIRTFNANVVSALLSCWVQFKVATAFSAGETRAAGS